MFFSRLFLTLVLFNQLSDAACTIGTDCTCYSTGCVCDAGFYGSNQFGLNVATQTCVPCLAGSYSFGNSLGCSVCPSGTQFVNTNSSCRPTNLRPSDTVFYLSGSSREGVAAFSTIINTSTSPLTYWVSDNPSTVPAEAIVSSTGGKLISNLSSLQSALPVGSAPFSVSSWVKCNAITSLSSPLGNLASWGRGYASYALKSLNVYVSSSGSASASSELANVGTLAGSGLNGTNAAVGTNRDGTGTNSIFYSPTGLAMDSSGNLYVSDRDKFCIRKVDSLGVVTTFAGSGQPGFADGVSTVARFDWVHGVAVDASGFLYIADSFNFRIRKITPNGDVSTIAGSSASGFEDGEGTNAKFDFPFGVAVDASGNIFVADAFNNRIRKVTSSGIVTTLAGSGVRDQDGNMIGGMVGGLGTNAMFFYPMSIAIDSSGNLYVGDVNNRRIRKVSQTGNVVTLAGGGDDNLDPFDGTGTNARFSAPYGVAVDVNGNVFVADSISPIDDPLNNRRSIRKITPGGIVSTIAGGQAAGYTDGLGTNALFNDPRGISVDSSGSLYVADTGDNRIRKILFQPRPFQVCDASWHHIALTFSGVSSKTMKTYIDGALTSSSTVVFDISSNESTLEIFSNSLPTTTAISDFRAFNRAVSAEEVLNLSYVPPIQCFAGFYASSGSCLPCPSGTFSTPGATSCSCLLCGGAGTVLDKISENITSIDGAVESLAQVSAVVDQLASFSNSSSFGGGSGANSANDANATALRTEIISLIGTITGVFSSSAGAYLSSQSSSSNASLLNDTTILIPAAVSELLATNLVSLTSNPAQLTQASASTALDSLADILTLNLPLNVLSGAVDAAGGVRNNSGVAPFPLSTATSFLSAINNVLNKFQENVVKVDESTSKNTTKSASAALNQIEGTLNLLTAAVLRSSNAGSAAVSVVSAPSTATFNSSSTSISGFCGDALSLTAMRVSVPSNSSSNTSSSNNALNIPLEKPLSPCLATGATVAKQQAVTPAVSANGGFLRSAKTATGALSGSVDASFVQFGVSPVPQSAGWSSMGGSNNQVLDASSSLDTRVVSFKLLSQSGQKLEIVDAASPMILSIPFTNPLGNSSSSSVVSSYSRLSFNVTCPGKSGLLVDSKSVQAYEFSQALKSSASVTKKLTTLSIVSRDPATGQAVVSVPCGGPIGIRNITCGARNTSFILSYDCPSISVQPVCAFWNETLNAWSSSGCSVAKYDRESISCSCNHTTNFAARFIALADQQNDLFSSDSFSALGNTEELFRMYPHVFIIIGVITGLVLFSGFITYELDVFASRRFYESLRIDPEVQFLERIETLKGNVFILDRVMDHKVHNLQEKILRARLQNQAKEIAESKGLYYVGPREDIPDDVNVNSFDWSPKKQQTYFGYFFSSCFSTRQGTIQDLDAEKRLQAPVMQTNPLQRKNQASPVDATTVAVRPASSDFDRGCLYRLTHRYTRAIYSKIKVSFESTRVSAGPKLADISKTAGVSHAVVNAVKPTSEFAHLESMADIESENVDGILEELQNATSCRRFMKLRSFLFRTWILFVLFNHPYLSIFSKFDPRNPRYMRMLKLLVVLIGNLWAATFLFAFVSLEVTPDESIPTDDGGEMSSSAEGGEETPKTIPEVILIALMSCLLQVPISLLTTFLIRTASVAEFDSRYPYIAAELRRRARVEAHLSQMSQSLLEAEMKNVSRTTKMDDSSDKGAPKLALPLTDLNKQPADGTPMVIPITDDDDDFDKEMFAKSSRFLRIPHSKSSPTNDHPPTAKEEDVDDFDKEMFAKSSRFLRVPHSQASPPKELPPATVNTKVDEKAVSEVNKEDEAKKDEFSFGWIDAPSEFQHYCPQLLRCCGRHPDQRSAYIEHMRKVDSEKRALFEKKKQEARERKHKKKLKLRLFKKKKKKSTVGEHGSGSHAHNTSDTAAHDAAFVARNAVATSVGVDALSTHSPAAAHDDHDDEEEEDEDDDAEGDELGDFQGSGDDTGDEILGWIIFFVTPLWSLFCSMFRNIDRVKTVESLENIIRDSTRDLKPVKGDKNKTLQEVDEASETQETILREVRAKYSAVKYLPCTVSMMITLTVCSIIMGFQIFYIALFGFRNDAEVTLSLTIAWVLSQAWNMFVIEPGMSFVELLFTFVIRPAWLPYILWIPHVGPVVGGKVASDLVCKDGRSVLSGRMQNLTLVHAAGAASQLSPDLSVAAYGFGAVISATLSNVEDKLLTMSNKAKKSATSAELKAAAKLSQDQRSELIIRRYTLAQLHSVEEAQKKQKLLAEKLAKLASTDSDKGLERLLRHSTHAHLNKGDGEFPPSPTIRAASVFKRAAEGRHEAELAHASVSLE